MIEDIVHVGSIYRDDNLTSYKLDKKKRAQFPHPLMHSPVIKIYLISHTLKNFAQVNHIQEQDNINQSFFPNSEKVFWTLNYEISLDIKDISINWPEKNNKLKTKSPWN